MGTDVAVPVSPIDNTNTEMDSASSLVDARFTSIEALAASTMTTALGHLQDLSNLASGSNVPVVTTTVNHTPGSTEWTKALADVGGPSDITLSDTLPDLATSVVIGTFLDTVDFASLSITTPSTYVGTSVFTTLLTKLHDSVTNGGTGLDSTVEAAIWAQTYL